MTVYFDLLGVQNRDHGERGIARLISQLAVALERSHPEAIDRYVVHPHLPIPEAIEPLLSTQKLVRSDRIDERPANGGVFIAGSAVELEESMETVLPHWARGPGWKSMAILYDLIPLRFPDEYLADDGLKSKYLDRIAAYSLFDRLLPISQTTLKDAVELIGFGSDRQSVIFAGVDDRFRPADSTDSRPPIEGVGEEYILFPTGMDWRKNVDRTIEAYGALPGALREKHQLVLACRLDQWMIDALQEQAGAAGILPGQLVLPGYLTDEQLVSLYQHAFVAIFPSLYEGFGLPAVEAMRCGAPVICADNSSLREVQPNTDARFDGTSTEAMTRALQRVLIDPDHRAAILERQQPEFTWGRSAGLLVEALDQCRPENRRTRLAIVTPLPPQASGIAVYSSRLLPELAKLVDVTVFTGTNAEEGEVTFQPVPGCEVKPVSQLETLHFGGQPFDRIVYMMGNSRFHIEALKALRRTGGAVLFHDARYTSLYNELFRVEPSALEADFVGEWLNQLYPDKYRAAVVGSHTIEAGEAHRFGILMAKEIASLASHRLCHSRYASRILELDTGLSFEAAFDLPTPAQRRMSGVRKQNLITSFGIVDPAKDPERLIEACSLVSSEDLVLRFVGECDPALHVHLLSVASEFGVELEITGYVSAEALEAQQHAATLAVQLRRHSNGESSGAVAELLAAGTPTITTKLGAFAELPEDAVRFVATSTSAAELANAIDDILSDPHRQLRMQEAARRYSEERTYAVAAAKLLKAVGIDGP